MEINLLNQNATEEILKLAEKIEFVWVNTARGSEFGGCNTRSNSHYYLALLFAGG